MPKNIAQVVKIAILISTPFLFIITMISTLLYLPPLCFSQDSMLETLTDLGTHTIGSVIDTQQDLKAVAKFAATMVNMFTAHQDVYWKLVLYEEEYSLERIQVEKQRLEVRQEGMQKVAKEYAAEMRELRQANMELKKKLEVRLVFIC